MDLGNGMSNNCQDIRAFDGFLFILKGNPEGPFKQQRAIDGICVISGARLHAAERTLAVLRLVQDDLPL
jgi:hypothetical protein